MALRKSHAEALAARRRDETDLLTDLLARLAALNCRQAEVDNPELAELMDRLNERLNPPKKVVVGEESE